MVLVLVVIDVVIAATFMVSVRGHGVVVCGRVRGLVVGVSVVVAIAEVVIITKPT